MSEQPEVAPRSKTGLIVVAVVGIALVLLFLLMLVPCVIIGGLTALGAALETSFESVNQQMNSARP